MYLPLWPLGTGDLLARYEKKKALRDNFSPRSRGKDIRFILVDIGVGEHVRSNYSNGALRRLAVSSLD